jgi:hypothetical protein
MMAEVIVCVWRTIELERMQTMMLLLDCPGSYACSWSLLAEVVSLLKLSVGFVIPLKTLALGGDPPLFVSVVS